MGLTTRLLRDWMRQKRREAQAMVDAVNPPKPTISIEDLPAQGQRWKRNPDGSWMRWSYLGEEWEAAEAPQELLDASQTNLAEDEWTRDPEGSWRPTGEERTARAQQADAAEPPSAPAQQSSTPPPAPPKPDPSNVPRPEWTSDWMPEWKDPYK